MDVGSRRAVYRWAVLGVAMVLALSACGTRLDHEDVLAASAVGSRSESATLLSGRGGTGTGDQEGTGDLGPATTPSDPLGAVAARSAARAAAGTGAGGRLGRPLGGQSGGGGVGGATMRIGSVSSIAGLAGAALKPAVDAVKIWVRMINGRGGINGHPVEYLVVDDGGDPARHKAAVQDMVENKGVIAFVGQFASITAVSARSYLEAKRMPVLGGEALGDKVWYESPMYFSQLSSNVPDGQWLAWKVQARFVKGAKKAASLVCVESQGCTNWQQYTVDSAPQHGFEVVYRGQASLGQPDFTAECILMRNAGATVVSAVFDFLTVRRVASSCARQGYHPQFVLAYGLFEASFAKEDAFQGSAGTLPVFPFMGGESPAAREYLDAYKRYAPNVTLESTGTAGWVAAKMFEKAAQGIGPGDKPATASVLAGLWSMRNETLGGLTAGLTFEEGKGSHPRGCAYPLLIQGKQWNAPDGMQPTCR